MVKIVEERACAKINLFLRVTGRRADGYHQLDSVFLPISLADEIRLEVRTAEETSITLNCDAPALRSSQNNLATRAARAFMSEFDLAAEIQIDLTKKIPIAAGLGGGSSDAGAVLRMLWAMVPCMSQPPWWMVTKPTPASHNRRADKSCRPMSVLP